MLTTAPSAGNGRDVSRVVRGLALAAVALGGLATPPGAAAATRHVHGGDSIADAVSAATAGDTIVLHAGDYAVATISQAFRSPVAIRAAGGERVRVAGLIFDGARNVHVLGLRIAGTISVVRSAALRFNGVAVAPPGPFIDGFRFMDHARDIEVSRSRVTGGRFNVLMWGSATDAWPSTIRIVDSELAGPYVDNVQIGGGRDVTLEHNVIRDPRETAEHNDGVQAIASDGLRLIGNRLSTPASALRGAPDQAILLSNADPPEPGRVVRDTLIVNNLVTRWRGTGITLAGSDKTLLLNNTAYDNGAPGQRSTSRARDGRSGSPTPASWPSTTSSTA
jgi:parallel beta-helix repeat protein